MTKNAEPDPALNAQQIVTGPLQENCFLLWRSDQKGALVFDPGDEAERIAEEMQAKGLQPSAFLQTHCHGDHIGALEELMAKFPEAPLHVHEAEEEWMTSPLHNLSYFTIGSVTGPAPDVLVKGGEVLDLIDLQVRVIHVPGHSPGGTAYYVEDPGGGPPHAFVGDILFAGSIGRTDFPGSEGAPALIRNIRERLFTLPNETVVHTGHGPDTTIGEEKKSNPYCGENAEEIF